MKLTWKSIALLVITFSADIFALTDSNPYISIDAQAQEMVQVIRDNQDLYASDPELFKNQINFIFEPMVDFRRVGASVMGKKYYLAATKEQRLKFIDAFKKSLLDTYSSTLSQWGDQQIETIFPENPILGKTVDVNQNLVTSNNIYPIRYKVRNDGTGNWLIINIVVNGVNLGLTFRNQFQALAEVHNDNIDEIINHWTSDVGL